MEKVNCDLCGSENYTIKHRINVKEQNMKFYRYVRNVPNKDVMIGIFNIVECSNCKLLYTNPRFSTSELEVVYSSNKIIGGKWKNFNYLFNSKLSDEMQIDKNSKIIDSSANDWKFDIINSYVDTKEKALKLLDVGCGNGKFVHDSISKGFDAYGIDLSPDRINEGKRLYGLLDRIKNMNVNDLQENQKYDIITLWDVIEHVESPSNLLKEIKKISHKNTKIFALTMSIDSLTYKLFKKDWKYINPTQHLHYFSHSTMQKMFETNDFKLIGCEMDDSREENFIHFLKKILIGRINYLFFKVYSTENYIKLLFKPFQKGMSNERMKKRIENLYPGKYIGRYHDNFIFIGELKELAK